MQTPFVTFGFGLGNTVAAQRIQRSILQVRIDGLGKNKRTAIFPKLIYTLKEGHNLHEEDPCYPMKRKALECSSKRMYPDILSYPEVVKHTGSFKAPMGCRSFLSAYEEDGKFIHDGRFNMGVVSVNLPRVALKSSSVEEFWEELARVAGIAKEALFTRIERLKALRLQ